MERKSSEHSYLAKFLGTYILESRKEQGITQNELAKRVGFSPQFMGRIEKGEVMIPEDALIQAIRILDLEAKKIVNLFRLAGELGGQRIVEEARGKKKRARNA